MIESNDDKVCVVTIELTNAPRVVVEMAAAAALKRCGELTDDLARVTAERDAAIARAEKADAHVGRIIDAVDCQMKSTGLPADLVDVVRGVAMETSLTTWRLAELERVCRDQQSRADAAERARDAAIARAERGDEQMERELADAIRARDELGIQYAAVQAEIARMKPVVEAARLPLKYGVRDAAIDAALRAIDAVPGDALAKVGTLHGASVYVDPTLPEGYVRRVPPAPIKVGDRVRILRESRPAYGFVGEEGTVLAIDPPDETGVYGVQVSGVGTHDKIWWHTSDSLAVVPPSPADALAPGNVKGGE